MIKTCDAWYKYKTKSKYSCLTNPVMQSVMSQFHKRNKQAKITSSKFTYTEQSIADQINKGKS